LSEEKRGSGVFRVRQVKTHSGSATRNPHKEKTNKERGGENLSKRGRSYNLAWVKKEGRLFRKVERESVNKSLSGKNGMGKFGRPIHRDRGKEIAICQR